MTTSELTNPSLIFSASLVTSLVLWYPTMMTTLRGHLGLKTAGLRYLVAFALARVAVGGLARLVDAYHQPAAPPDGPAETSGSEDETPRRRSDDQVDA